MVAGEVLTNDRQHRPWTRLRSSFQQTKVWARTQDPCGPSQLDSWDDYTWLLHTLSRSLPLSLLIILISLFHLNFSSFLLISLSLWLWDG